MDQQERDKYLEEYQEDKEKGVPFFPDIIFKDAIVVLLVFLALLALATFVGAPLEERADPADASYTPRPEWYFMFLFQLLKYFPGELEVIGVVLLPTVAIVLLFLLPFLDRSAKRHFLNRPWVSGVTTLTVASIVFLTVQSMREAPPPAEAEGGDATAQLYAANCAGCHGPTLTVPAGVDLHGIIAQGRHDDMPAWSADLTADEIDALAGFIVSPAGSLLFTEQCGACHEATDLVATSPVELKNALELGTGFPAHAQAGTPNWRETLASRERTSLLNFLLAPDGHRLFVTNCSPCHGTSVRVEGDEADLRAIIVAGGLHLEMPPWQERLSADEIAALARYVVDPANDADAVPLFERHCARCHGERIPRSESVAAAQEIIATGGSHESMPVWGEVLTSEQITALVAYTLEAASGTPEAVGQQLYGDYCATCHGDLGEGGENPARPGDVIAPISSAEYLRTRDNFTLRAIIAQGQPNFGMSPFASVHGGPLDDEDIDALVRYVRSWEANPPVDLPPELPSQTLALSGYEIYSEICAQCHGLSGRGDVGPNLRDPDFRDENTSEMIFDSISHGHAATEMIAWGSVLSSDQILQIVNFIEQLPIDEPAVAEAPPTETPTAAEAAVTPEPTAEPTPAPVSFSADVMPLFEFRCLDCHGRDGGWDSSTHDLIINSGDHGPAVIPGDPEGSLLAQKLLGTHAEGDIMPPSPLRALRDEQIQLVLQWIAEGALDN